MAWDAEGKRLLCNTGSGRGYGFLSLRDLTLTPLKTPRSRIYDPALSPDGRFLAYSYRNGRFQDIELVATNGEHDPIQLTAATRDPQLHPHHDYGIPLQPTTGRRFGHATAAPFCLSGDTA